MPLQDHQRGLSHQITAFDGSKIYNDKETLERWLKRRVKNQMKTDGEFCQFSIAS